MQTIDDRKREAVKELMDAALAVLDKPDDPPFERLSEALEKCRILGVDD
jgi:hypothetical protein